MRFIEGMEDLRRVLVLGQLVVAAASTGLIWVVQLVLYPQFPEVGIEAFAKYHDAYMRRITWIVAPLMLAELGLAIASLAVFREGAGRSGMLAGFLLLVVIWTATAVLQVPLHNQLAAGAGEETMHRLVQTNWIRTAAWTARLLLFSILTWRCLAVGAAPGLGRRDDTRA